MRRSPFEHRHRVTTRIPSVSMAGIAFLMLAFFMATTIFKTDDRIDVRFSRSEVEATEPGALHVRIDPQGRVWIDEQFVASEQIQGLVRRASAARPGLVIAFNADARLPYRSVAAVLEELKAANATHVSFASEPRPQGTAR